MNELVLTLPLDGVAESLEITTCHAVQRPLRDAQRGVLLERRMWTHDRAFYQVWRHRRLGAEQQRERDDPLTGAATREPRQDFFSGVVVAVVIADFCNECAHCGR